MKTSKKICNAIRRQRDLKPPVTILIARQKGEPQGKRDIRKKAEKLYADLNGKGATWAACVQAIKTDWVANLIGKYR